MALTSKRLHQGIQLIILYTALFLLPSNYANAQRTGDQLFNTYCIACHMSGVAGAPKFGDNTDWQPRINKGIDKLLSNAINGIKAMPPRGFCMDCSDDELKIAIQYMIENSQK
ncbi:c-type cytochrome [Marinomonas transparens]|uniref:c-type cytochrome n=1 Tax=Marinomonas transparens TaxID=2795388 RepID=UPI002D808B3A|nr:cytochrome c5 family protein [Marinomonas transparens]